MAKDREAWHTAAHGVTKAGMTATTTCYCLNNNNKAIEGTLNLEFVLKWFQIDKVLQASDRNIHISLE